MSTLNFDVKITVIAEHDTAAAVQAIIANYCYGKMAVIEFSSSNFSFDAHKWYNTTELKYIFLGQVKEDSSIRACLDFEQTAAENLKKILPLVKSIVVE